MVIGWRYEFARFLRRRGGEAWTAVEFARAYEFPSDDAGSFLRVQLKRGHLAVVANEPKRYTSVLGDTVCAMVMVGPR